MADAQPNPVVGRPNRVKKAFTWLGKFLGLGPQAATSQQGINYAAMRPFSWTKLTEESPGFPINEIPIRDAENQRLYAEMYGYLGFIRPTIETIAEDAMTDDTGQTRGFWIETGNDDMDQLLNTCPAIRRESEDGSRFMATAIQRGDCFLEHIYQTKQPQLGLTGLKELYAAEMFRIEDWHGRLLRFEQRALLTDKHAIQFHPAMMNHIRMNPQASSPYGFSWLHPIRKDFELWKRAVQDAHTASMTRAPLRLKHMFEHWDENQFAEHRRQLQEQVYEDVDRDYYCSKDRVDSTVMGGDSNVLRSYQLYIESLEQRIKIPLRVPNLLIGYDSTIRGRDVSLTSERGYIRRLNSLRALYSRAVVFTVIIHLSLIEHTLGQSAFMTMDEEGMFTRGADSLFNVLPYRGKINRQVAKGTKINRWDRNDLLESAYFVMCDAAMPSPLPMILSKLRVVWPQNSTEGLKEKAERYDLLVNKMGLSQRTALEDQGFDYEKEKGQNVEAITAATAPPTSTNGKKPAPDEEQPPAEEGMLN